MSVSVLVCVYVLNHNSLQGSFSTAQGSRLVAVSHPLRCFSLKSRYHKLVIELNKDTDKFLLYLCMFTLSNIGCVILVLTKIYFFFCFWSSVKWRYACALSLPILLVLALTARRRLELVQIFIRCPHQVKFHLKKIVVV